MKRLFALGFTLLLIAVTGCGDDDSPAGPGVPAETGVNVVSIAPSSPSILKYYQTASNDRVSIMYSYTVVEPSGARIWIQPSVWNSKSGSASVLYSPSPIYTGSGNKTVLVTAESSDDDTVHISQLEIFIRNPSTSDTISLSFIDVDYTFTK
jgi:hypothetical protein